MKRSDKTASRCSDEAALTRMFLNGVRGVLGKDELYPDGERTEEERFYVTPVGPQDGRVPPRRTAL